MIVEESVSVIGYDAGQAEVHPKVYSHGHAPSRDLCWQEYPL